MTFYSLQLLGTLYSIVLSVYLISVCLELVKYSLGNCCSECFNNIHNLTLHFASFLPFVSGSIFNFVLPEALKISAVEHDPNYQEYDSDKRRLRSSFSNCLSSISTRQKQLSSSSLFIQSPLKGCLPTWELSRSKKIC